jgi:hypothetical protein
MKNLALCDWIRYFGFYYGLEQGRGNAVLLALPVVNLRVIPFPAVLWPGPVPGFFSAIESRMWWLHPRETHTGHQIGAA